MQSFEEFWYDTQNYKLESCLKYHELKKGIQYANGCGAKGGIKFPNTMWFLLIIAACITHDIEWKMAKCYQDLVDANERFDNNLKLIIDKDSNFIMKRFRRLRAAKYVNEVELIGTNNYAKERGFIN